MEKPFICENCHKLVSAPDKIGTAHRNHCPFCLWSKHVDERVSGDRKSHCMSLMRPIGLTFKKEGLDKFTKLPKVGELMVVHRCTLCGKTSSNRIAADDNEQQILNLAVEDIEEVKKQLFGK